MELMDGVMEYIRPELLVLVAVLTSSAKHSRPRRT